jgi:hypothetical protein
VARLARAARLGRLTGGGPSGLRKAAEGLRMELREGSPWLSVKAQGRPRQKLTTIFYTVIVAYKEAEKNHFPPPQYL